MRYDPALANRRMLLKEPRPWLVILVLALAGMNASFMQTIILPIQSELPELLDAEREDTAWVVTVTLLAASVVTPIAGRLGDLYGKRRVAVVLLIALIVGSVIAALSTGLLGLLIGRALQGAVVGIIPLGISILRDVLHPDRLNIGVALVSATLGFGGAVGLPVSALVTENLEWHMLFWLAAALAAANCALVLAFVPPSTLRSPGSFDFVGAAGLTAGLTGILLAVSRGNEWGWMSLPTLGCGIGGVVVLLLWGWYELRRSSPLVDLRVAGRPAVLLTNLASIAMGFALFSSNVAFPQLLELPPDTGVGLGLPLLQSSLVLMPAGLVMMVLSPVAGRLIKTFGAQALLAAGAIVIVISYLVALFASSEVWHILVVNTLIGIGIGIGLGYAAMPTLIMLAVPNTETAAANGLNTLMRSLGTAFAAALVGTVFAQTSVSVDGEAVPTQGGFQLAFMFAAAAAAVCAVLALIPRPKVETEEDEHPSLPSEDAEEAQLDAPDAAPEAGSRAGGDPSGHARQPARRPRPAAASRLRRSERAEAQQRGGD